jgi:hypothetical protein
MTQRELDLDGWHAGPLFVVVKRRAPKLVSAFDGSRRIWGMRRRASERQAPPAWADPDLTRAFYRLARIYTEALGERFSVDHIVPLTDPRVCGLHWHGNFQILPLLDNVSKGTSHWPGMPEEQLELQ